MVRRQHALPGLRVLGLPPAQIPHRGLGVGNAGVDLHRAVLGIDAGELSVPQGDHVRHPGVLRHRGMGPVGTLAALAHGPEQHQQQQKGPQPQEPLFAPKQLDANSYVNYKHHQALDPAVDRVLVHLQKEEPEQCDQHRQDPKAQVQFFLSLFFHRSPSFSA